MRTTPAVRKFFSAMGKKGGKVKSVAKAQAVRQNGKKGGRPKQEKQTA